MIHDGDEKMFVSILFALVFSLLLFKKFVLRKPKPRVIKFWRIPDCSNKSGALFNEEVWVATNLHSDTVPINCENSSTGVFLKVNSFKKLLTFFRFLRSNWRTVCETAATSTMVLPLRLPPLLTIKFSPDNTRPSKGKTFDEMWIKCCGSEWVPTSSWEGHRRID